MNSASFGNISEDCHPDVRSLVDYWQSIHPADGLPGRRHFDPVDVPALLGNIGLIEVHENPRRFKARLYGTTLVSAVGKDLTNKWYHEVFEKFEQSGQYHDFSHVVDTRTPHWRRGTMRIPAERDFHFLERVHLPLASDGVSVDMILTFAIFFPRDDRLSMESGS